MSDLFSLVRGDVSRYNRSGAGFLKAIVGAAYNHPAFIGLVFYRFSRSLYLRGGVFRRFLLYIAKAIYPFVRMFSGVDVHPKCSIGRGAFFGHAGPIVIHPDVQIGDQVTIMQGVTLGHARTGVPKIGSCVSIGVNSVIVGGVEIGDYCVVGAGAVVVSNVPSFFVVGGVPAKKIGERTAEQYAEVIA
ncbi:serine O-acetyltransferase [Methyloversatilis discipulorum]|uniref:serine O-acetyltransferase n=1 Tax=Methyloversatilis discipulorum TaxID=1119528 RepID=UPI003F31E717